LECLEDSNDRRFFGERLNRAAGQGVDNEPDNARPPALIEQLCAKGFIQSFIGEAAIGHSNKRK
jgi:hypothetical protein